MPLSGRAALQRLSSRSNREPTDAQHSVVLDATNSVVSDSTPGHALDAIRSVARSGDPTLSVNGVALHSTVSPAREAQRLAEARNEQVPGVDCFVVFGCGLGYLVNALLELRPDVPVVVVEPAPDLVLETAAFVPDVPFWGSDELPQLLRTMQESDVRVPALVAGRAFQHLFPDQWRLVRESIESYVERTRVNRNTIRRFGRTWVRNILRTAAAGVPVISLEALRDAFAGIPALVCGAGPTLERILPALPDIARRTVVISVETAAARVSSAGVVPDFVVTVDPQYWNTRHVDNLPERSPILVTEPAANPRSLRLWSGTVALAESVFPLGREIWGAADARSRLGAGGSVATSAWDLARFVGAPEVYLSGVDLGFPGNATHCRGTFYDDYVRTLAVRTRPAESYKHRLLGDASPQAVRAAGGGEVLSDRRMHVYRAWFEDQLESGRAPTTYLTAKESSAIKGAHFADLADASIRSSLKDVRDEIDRRRAALDNYAERMGLRTGVFEELTSVIVRIEERARRSVDVCDEIVRRGSADAGDLRRVDALDAQLLADERRHIAGFLLGDAADAAIAARAEDALSSVKQSAAIHRAVAESAQYHIALLSRYR